VQIFDPRPTVLRDFSLARVTSFTALPVRRVAKSQFHLLWSTARLIALATNY
jgi:hypothetical protein